MIQICSLITRGRVLNGELCTRRFLEVNLFAFAYRLFHEVFSPRRGATLLLWSNSAQLNGEKSS